MAADWPQYRGPDQTGATAEKVLLDWQAGGPKLLWKIPTPNGFSSFAVSGGKAYTQVNRDRDGQPREVCLALDALTGKELWAADVGEGRYPGGGDTGAPGNDGGDGPRSTPTCNDGRVYVATPNLVLYCLDASTGQPIWTKDLIKEHAGRNIGWKNAASPVIDGDLLFVGGGGPGQSLLALDKKAGKVVWKGFDEHITHATPVVTTILGRRQVIFFLQSGLLSVAAEDGKALWRFPMRYSVSTAASPVVSGDIVYCGAGYGVGGAACKIGKTADGFKATELWRISGIDKVLSHWSTPVCEGRLPVRHVQLQEVRQRPDEVRRDRHRQDRLAKAGFRPRQRDPRRRPAPGPGRRRTAGGRRGDAGGLPRDRPGQGAHRQVLVHPGARAMDAFSCAAPKKGPAWH